MSNYHATYSSRATSGNWGGIPFTDGKSDSVYFSVTQNSPRASFRKGLDGRTSASLSADHSAIVTVTVFPESNSGKKLAAAYFAQKVAEMQETMTLGALPLIFNDPSGAVLLACPEAVMQNMGDLSLGEDTGEVTFEFYVPNLLATPLPSGLAGQLNKTIDKLGFI